MPNCTLYSVQPLWVYERLRAGEVFVSSPFEPGGDGEPNQFEDFRPAYEWLGSTMRKRGLLPENPNTAFPVWAWHTWYNRDRRKPDLRTSSLRNWAKDEPHVLLTLRMAEERVLLSDFDTWHWALNYWYLDTEENAEAFLARCESQGVTYYRHKPLPNPALHNELVQTWERIFDLPLSRRFLGTPDTDNVVQATFWELRPEDVRRAVQFGAGGRRRVLASGLRQKKATPALTAGVVNQAA